MNLDILVPGVIKSKIYGYFIDICRIDHCVLLEPSLKLIVLNNAKRISEIKIDFIEAIYSGDCDTLMKLLEFGHRYYTNYFDEENPLRLAISHGHSSCSELLINNDPLLKYDTPRGTMITQAIYMGNIHVLGLLLDRGYYPWGLYSNPNMNLMEWYCMDEVIQMYLDHGIYFSSYLLLEEGCFYVLRYLMDHGYDPTEELYVGNNFYNNWIGTRSNLFKLIYVTCINLDLNNCKHLVKIQDHDDGFILKYDEKNPYLLKYIENIRVGNEERYSFMWLQE